MLIAAAMPNSKNANELAVDGVVNVVGETSNDRATDTVGNHGVCRWLPLNKLQLLTDAADESQTESCLLLIPLPRLNEVKLCSICDDKLITGHRLRPESLFYL